LGKKIKTDYAIIEIAGYSFKRGYMPYSKTQKLMDQCPAYRKG
jgi:hypothetical protein